MPDVIARLNDALAGRYRVERELGEGGMATVFLAQDTRHDRNVALKVLKPELAAVVGAARFLSEIRTTANLQHPHILPLFDSGEADGLLFYVMPYVEGESLRDRLDREHQLSVDVAVRIATNLAEALDYAHRRGVIHRDIKPANVLLLDGKAIISDFGIALAVSKAGSGRMTETGLSLGTPHYMSPEQATGDVGVGPASDIWALGCVLYEMLVGEPPYTGSTPQAILGKIITAEPPFAATVRKSVPANVDAGIRRALEKVPADRFPTAGEFAKALSDPRFEPARVSGTTRRHVSVVTAGLGVLSAALAVAIAWVTLSPGNVTGRGPVSRQAISVPPAAPLVPTQLSRDVAISPDGETMVYRAGTDSAHLVARRLDALETVPLPGTADALWPVFSPDGDLIAFQAGGVIRTIPIAGGVSVPVAETGVRVIGMDWTPADSIVFGGYLATLRGLQMVSVGGGEVTPLTTTDGTVGHVLPDVLPGGVGMLFAVRRDPIMAANDQIAVLDATTGEQRVVIESGTAPRYAPSGHIVFIRGRVLMAVPFDLDRLEVVGNAVAIVGGIIVGFDGSASFDLSATGSLLYAAGGTNVFDPRIPVWVDQDGTEEPLPFPPRRYLYPALSPSGGQLAVGVGEDSGPSMLWVFDPVTADGRQVTRGETHSPMWISESALAIAYRIDGRFLRVHTVTVDGEAEPQLASAWPANGSEFPTSVTPDGRFVIATRSSGSGRSTFTESVRVPLRSDESEASIHRGEFIRGSSVVSPDGRWLVFQSNQSGRHEIYVQPNPGPGPAVQVSVGGGMTPAWSRDGLRIFYRLDDRMMAAPFGRTGELGRPVELFRGSYLPSSTSAPRMYDVAADGRFLMLKSVSAEGADVGPQVVLVQNWLEELAARVPR